jgi:hypothetical protein
MSSPHKEMLQRMVPQYRIKEVRKIHNNIATVVVFLYDKDRLVLSLMKDNKSMILAQHDVYEELVKTLITSGTKWLGQLTLQN